MAQTIINLAQSAVRDLEAIQGWYAEQGAPEVGERTVADMFQRIQALGEHPEMGRIVPEFDQSLLRELIHPPFGIVYRRGPEGVSVVRVWRSERLLHLPSSGDEGA